MLSAALTRFTVKFFSSRHAPFSFTLTEALADMVWSASSRRSALRVNADDGSKRISTLPPLSNVHVVASSPSKRFFTPEA